MSERRRQRVIEACVFGAALLAYGWFHQGGNWLQNATFAQVRAIVEQGTFALGFLRYGLHDQVERISRALFEAAGLFDLYRLPELFSGHARDDAHPFPAIYPRANWPQA